MTKAIGVDFIIARGSNLTSLTVMLASINNNTHKLKTEHKSKNKKETVQNLQIEHHDKRSNEKRNENLGFLPITHLPKIKTIMS